MKPYRKALVIFRRDLRTSDNHALQKALSMADQVVCLFVVEPAFNHKPGERHHAKQFLLAALVALDRELHNAGGGLAVHFGSLPEVLPALLAGKSIDAVFVNADYTPPGRRRDAVIEKLARQQKADFYAEDDLLLFAPGMILKNDGSPYTVFTPFFRKAAQYPVESVADYHLKGLASPAERLDVNALAQYWQVDASKAQKQAGMILQGWRQRITELADYGHLRDFPAADGSSRLSAHLKCGTLSVRQVWHQVRQSAGTESPLLRQLYWRDFYHHILFHFPHALGSAFNRRYSNIRWRNNHAQFNAWCRGETGFPIVDAGMRELAATGFMHNRVRMIVASFLVKDLHIDWRWGERHFARQLVDYDMAVNNGNWQWAASTGCDAQPYFRIFNPWLQQKKFDPDCVYIKRWVPELAGLPARDIHRLDKAGGTMDYPAPMVDHAEMSRMAKAMFKNPG